MSLVRIRGALMPCADGWRAVIIINEDGQEVKITHPKTFPTQEEAKEVTRAKIHAFLMDGDSDGITRNEIPPTSSHCDKCGHRYHTHGPEGGEILNATCPPPCGGNIVKD